MPLWNWTAAPTSRDSLDTLLFGSYSTRADAPACLAEAAQNGTLYLAHIEALSPELQFKILQLIGGKIWRNGASQPAQAAVRVVASSNADLPALLQEGLFRSDLYYALNVLSLALPPLRARRADILPWADRYLSEAQEQYKRYVSLTNGAREFLQKYDWPGNLDQLHSVCERTVLLAPRRSVDEVSCAPAAGPDPRSPGSPEQRLFLQPGTDRGLPASVRPCRLQAVTASRPPMPGHQQDNAVAADEKNGYYLYKITKTHKTKPCREFDMLPI